MLVPWERALRRVGETGGALMLDSGTLTPLLKGMQTNGLITRTRNPHDERHVSVAPSANGRALKRLAGKIPELTRCRIDLPATALKALRE